MMDDLVLSTDEAEKIVEEDPLFGNLIKSSLERVKGMVKEVILSAPKFEDTVGAGASIAEILQEGDQYVAKFPNEVKRGLSSGNLEKMKKGATNLWNGTIRNASGDKAIEAQANFEKVKLTPQRLQGLQSLALQAQIRQISKRLEDLSGKVEKVLEGQHGDRVGQVEAGINEYQLAETYEDPEKGDLRNAQQSLLQGRDRLKRWLEGTIEPPRNTEGLTEKLWSLIGVMPSRVEHKKQLEEEKERIKEALQAYVIASGYLLKIQLIRGERDAADQLINNHIREIGIVTEKLMDETIPIHPEIRKFGRNIEEVRGRLKRIQSGSLELKFSREYLLR